MKILALITVLATCGCSSERQQVVGVGPLQSICGGLATLPLTLTYSIDRAHMCPLLIERPSAPPELMAGALAWVAMHKKAGP